MSTDAGNNSGPAKTEIVMSVTAAEMEQVEQHEDTLRSNGFEMMNVITQRLPYFRRVAMRYLHDEADVEDALQDAFLAAWKHLDQFKGQSKISTWLTTIVMNSSLTIIRKRGRVSLLSIDDQNKGESYPQFLDLLQDCHSDPEAQFRDFEYECRLHQLFAHLPPTLRVIVYLRTVEELSTREIAETLGLTVSAVKTRAFRAQAKLRRLDRETPRRLVQTSSSRMSQRLG